MGMCAVMIVLSLAHSSNYIKVITAKTSFFTNRCVTARTIPLPEGLADLSLEDEPSLFLSLGRYMERLSK